MAKYDALFEDEDNIFGGSPKSKFWDILNTASDDLVKDQMDRFFEKFTVMETLLTEQHGEEELNQLIKNYAFENSTDLEFNKKSTYIELTGEIVCRLDS
jgi:endonuclease III